MAGKQAKLQVDAMAAGTWATACQLMSLAGRAGGVFLGGAGRCRPGRSALTH